MRYILCAFFILISIDIYSQCTHPDYDALMQIYDETGGENWFSKEGWAQGKAGTSCDPCDYNGLPWDFVNCTNGRVVSLYISQTNMTGHFPDVSLEKLQTFTIVDNKNLESVPDFSKFPELEVLHLMRCNLTGKVPPFEGLNKLQDLNLNENKFSGTIPNYNLPNLKRLNLRGNQLVGELPSLNFAPQLIVIKLQNNQLTGKLPSYDYLTELINYDVEGNLFSGAIPDFSNNPKISDMVFFAGNNNLSGCFPEALCDLKTVELASNELLPWRGEVNNFCEIGSQLNAPCSFDDTGSLGIVDENCDCIPVGCDFYKEDFDELMLLYTSTIGENWMNQGGWHLGSVGEICSPCDFNNAPWYGVKCRDGSVVGIDLDGDPSFSILGIGGNGLGGVLPELKMEKLEALHLAENNIGGELPSFAGVPNLQTLTVTRNNFVGPLPDFQEINKLKFFRGSNNAFTGPLPDFNLLDSLRTFTCASALLHGCYSPQACDLFLFDVKNNPALPWSGNPEEICQEEDQIGAPCNIGLGDAYVINENCDCVLQTSLEDIEENRVVAYPNPFSEFIQINLKTSVNSTLYNCDGQLIMSSTESRIDATQLSSGIYFLKLNLEEPIIYKLVKLN